MFAFHTERVVSAWKVQLVVYLQNNFLPQKFRWHLESYTFCTERHGKQLPYRKYGKLVAKNLGTRFEPCSWISLMCVELFVVEHSFR